MRQKDSAAAICAAAALFNAQNSMAFLSPEARSYRGR